MKDESILPEEIRGYDWEHAFQCCGPAEEDSSCFNDPCVSAAIDKAHVSIAPFQRVDVAEILAAEEGENDGPNWIGVFRLKDGRYAFLSAGCDYTGWDCRSGGHAIVDDDLDHLIQLGLGADDRARLKLPVL